MSTYNISVTQGETLDLDLTLKDSQGNPVNLSGYNIRGKVKYSYGYPNSIYDLEPSISGDGTSGFVNVTIEATGTANLPVTKAYYEIERYTNDDVFVGSILNGAFTVNPQVGA